MRIAGNFTIALATTALVVTASALAADNPHWNKAGCPTCHVDAVPTAGNPALREPDASALCEACHAGRGGARPCRHVSGIAPGDLAVPESHVASLQDGRIVCTTCHDLAVQCKSPHPGYRSANPGFVRARVSRSRSDACFACHEKTDVEQLNPHEMTAGDPPQPTCTFCHATMPVRAGGDWVAVDFHVDGSLNDICVGCHRVQAHPGSSFDGPIGWVHLAVPSPGIRENMKQAEQRHGFRFPVDPATGEIHCATCHNPHHDSLQGYPVADVPDDSHRLRVIDNCQACHDL